LLGQDWRSTVGTIEAGLTDACTGTLDAGVADVRVLGGSGHRDGTARRHGGGDGDGAAAPGVDAPVPQPRLRHAAVRGTPDEIGRITPRWSAWRVH